MIANPGMKVLHRTLKIVGVVVKVTEGKDYVTQQTPQGTHVPVIELDNGHKLLWIPARFKVLSSMEHKFYTLCQQALRLTIPELITMGKALQVDPFSGVDLLVIALEEAVTSARTTVGAKPPESL